MGGKSSKNLDQEHSNYVDKYKSLDQVTDALVSAGFDSSNLIVGIDFTESNEWTGLRSFNGRSLHDISDGLNPYEQVISIIGKALPPFNKDNVIPCFGFGDVSTEDEHVFGFYPDEKLCNGYEKVLSRYREIVPHVQFAGPTSFAPIIEMAMTIVEQSGGQYHVLLIIANGQVSRSLDTKVGHLSPQEQKTVDAIVAASKLPVSIILVGVGDWCWHTIKEFEDKIPAQALANFQFVNFTEIMLKNHQQSEKEIEFALSALMQIPSQYDGKLNILGRRQGNVFEKVALLPPPFFDEPYQGELSYQGESGPVSSSPPAPSSTYDNQVTEALARAGLESFNLIVGIDFTSSNKWTGSRSFNGRSLHDISDGLNPYQEAISIIGKTLAAFVEDILIPCFGFGDKSTLDVDVFSFYPNERFCNGFEEVLSRYREIMPHLQLAGPTSFAPIIEMAMTIVEQSGGQYHVLLIIADGQVTRSVDTKSGYLSPEEQKTIDAIVSASKLPLSIILVGVGDGPWDMMKEFDDNIPSRAFNNFQFVNFTEIMSENHQQSQKETEFAHSALKEIPSQYKATMELNILGRKQGNVSERVALPPPFYDVPSSSISKPFHSTSFNTNAPPYQVEPSYQGESRPVSSAPPVTSSTYDNQVCAICLTNQKDMAFGCGHQTCCECGQDLQLCPMCRSPIQTRIKLY